MLIRRSLITVTMSFVTTAVAVVACGPGDDRVPVNIVKPNQTKKPTTQCQTRIPSAKSILVNESIKTASGAKPVAMICESSDEEAAEKYSEKLATTGHAKNPDLQKEVPYVLKETPLSYRVSHEPNGLRVALDVGVLLPEGLTKEMTERSMKTLHEVCVGQIRKAWRESNLSASLEITLGEVPVSVFEHKKFDQVIAFAPIELGGKDYFPAFSLVQAPDRGRFMPNGYAAECPDKMPNRRECIEKSRRTANAAFCKQFAVLTAQWLGLDAGAKDSAQCQANKKAEGATGFAAAVHAAPESFFDQLRFSDADLKKILEPACGSR